MDNSSIFPAQEPPPSYSPSNSSGGNNNLGKKIIYVFLGLLILFAIGSVSYLIGKQGKNDEIASTSPSPQVLAAPSSYNNGQNTFATPTSQLSAPSPLPTSSPTPTPQPLSKIITSSATLDGFVSSNKGVVPGLDIRAGRNSTQVVRGFVSFDLTKLPSGANVVQATLRMYQLAPDDGGHPYTAGGVLKIDHINYGDTLDSTDYASAALLSSFATLSTNPSVEWKEADVTAEVKDDIDAARTNSQYRIHFENENTGGSVTGDFAHFESADNSEATGNIPQLVIKYN